MKNPMQHPHQRCMTFFKSLWSEVDAVELCPLFALSQQPEAVAAALMQPETLPFACQICLRHYLDSTTSPCLTG